MIEKARGCHRGREERSYRPSFRALSPTSPTQVGCPSRSARTLPTDEHRKVIERYVNEAGSFNAELIALSLKSKGRHVCIRSARFRYNGSAVRMPCLQVREQLKQTLRAMRTSADLS